MHFAVKPHHSCSSGSPDPDPFVIRRSQTTEVETHIGTMELAGDRQPRYDKKRPPLTVGRGPVPRHRACTRHLTLAGACPPRYGEKNAFPSRRTVGKPVPRHRSRARPVGQDRLILTRSGSGEPELQRWARCLPKRSYETSSINRLRHRIKHIAGYQSVHAQGFSGDITRQAVKITAKHRRPFA